ncbi:MAG TPA: hypothetical protein VI248_05825 [Kineosporiaceae bacterium]
MTAMAGDETKTRKSVPLTARDLADLDLISRSPEAREAIGATAVTSESALLHALMAAGLRVAREAAEAAAYAEYAEWAATDPEEVAIRAALRGTRNAREARRGDDA